MEILYSAVALGGNIRVGMEDNVMYSKGVLAESNRQFVERCVRVIKEYGNNEFPKAYGYLGPFDIPLEYLKEGTNTFTFSTDYIGGSTSKWRSFSFHRFELQPADMGTMLILR